MNSVICLANNQNFWNKNGNKSVICYQTIHILVLKKHVVLAMIVITLWHWNIGSTDFHQNLFLQKVAHTYKGCYKSNNESRECDNVFYITRTHTCKYGAKKTTNFMVLTTEQPRVSRYQIHQRNQPLSHSLSTLLPFFINLSPPLLSHTEWFEMFAFANISNHSVFSLPLGSHIK